MLMQRKIPPSDYTNLFTMSTVVCLNWVVDIQFNCVTCSKSQSTRSVLYRCWMSHKLEIQEEKMLIPMGHHTLTTSRSPHRRKRQLRGWVCQSHWHSHQISTICAEIRNKYFFLLNIWKEISLNTTCYWISMTFVETSVMENYVAGSLMFFC